MNALDLVLLAAAALLLIALLAALWALSRARSSAATLSAELIRAEERVRGIEEGRAGMADFLRLQAAESANAVAEQLVVRASETFRSQEQLVQARLEAQLKPMSETLAKFEAKVQAIDKARAEEAGGLKQQITALMQASIATQDEARKLSAALRRGAGVQGRWGEQTLRNVLEAAGLTRFDFTEQTSTTGDDGARLRPDVTVRMPGGGLFVIDAKCSLNAFLEGQDAADEAMREGCYLRHAQSVKSHMVGLSNKAYWEQFKKEGSPDFVAMFVPGDSFLAAALDRMPDLMTEAMDKRVILVTPTTLFALCKAVAYGWRVEEQARNADQIAQAGRDLHKRVYAMTKHVLKLGDSLTRSVGAYNDFAGSLERNVITQARRLEGLAAGSGEPLPDVDLVEDHIRPLAKLALVEDDEAPALKGPDAA